MKNLLFVFLPIFVWSCGNSTTTENQKNDLQFTVEEKLLAEEFRDTSSGVRLRVPVEWHPVKHLTNDRLKHTFTSILSDDTLIQAIYVDTVHQASLICTRVNAQFEELQRAFNNPDSAYNSNKQWNSVLKSNFMLNGISVNQFLLQNADLVNFRLVCIDGLKNKFQLDYIMSRNAYLLQIKKVESSIGTISIFQ